MSLSISDEKMIKSQSGIALRFTVHVYLDTGKQFGMSVKGFLAFRNAKQEIEVKPPVSMINVFGRRIKYRGTDLTPDLKLKIEEYLKDHHDDKITSDPDWNEVRKARRLVAKHGGLVL